MARRKRSESETQPASEEALPEYPEAPVEEEPKAPSPEPQAPADVRPRLTAKQMFRGAKDPIAKAFLHVENLQQKRTRKLPREEWKNEFEKFRAEERR